MCVSLSGTLGVLLQCVHARVCNCPSESWNEEQAFISPQLSRGFSGEGRGARNAAVKGPVLRYCLSRQGSIGASAPAKPWPGERWLAADSTSPAWQGGDGWAGPAQKAAFLSFPHSELGVLCCAVLLRSDPHPH